MYVLYWIKTLDFEGRDTGSSMEWKQRHTETCRKKKKKNKLARIAGERGTRSAYR